jgi:acyl carrier protein
MKRDEIFSALTSNLRAEIKELGGRTIRETDGPQELGGHSLQVMEAITSTMKELRLSVSRDALLRTRNLGDVLDLFERSAGR